MRPRHPADYRSLLWALAFCPLVPTLSYVWPGLAPWLLPLALWLAYSVGAIAHNHNHRPVFAGRAENAALGAWLSFFYGAPIIFWIPTHNQNHHKYLNGPGDATGTSRFATEDSFSAALRYPFHSSLAQLPLIWRFITHAARRRPRVFRQFMLQAGALALGHLLALGLALRWYGLVQGGLVYALALGLPALFAPWVTMFTNYLQHVGCDPGSADRHSRNFVDRRYNWLMFNGGYHTVHHEHPGVHWSRYPELHRERSAAIGRDLEHATLAGYCFHAYGIQRGRAAAQSGPPPARLR